MQVSRGLQLYHLNLTRAVSTISPSEADLPATYTRNQVGQGLLVEPAGDEFGKTLAISDDGFRIAIGAPDKNSDQGLVQVYGLKYGTWTQNGQDLIGPDGSSRFGGVIGFSSDGTRISIAARGFMGGITQVYEYKRNVWNQLGETFVDSRGIDIALSSDGNRIVIGSHLVKVYENRENAWTQVGPTVTRGIGVGRRVAISSDGSRVAVSEFESRGNVQIYEFAGNVWTQVGQNLIRVGNGSHYARIALSSDGTRIAIGGDVLRLYDFTGDAWRQIGQGLTSWHTFALSGDGTRIAIARLTRNPSLTTVEDESTVHVYELQGNTWNPCPQEVRHTGWISRLSLSSNGSRLAFGVSVFHPIGEMKSRDGRSTGLVKVFEIKRQDRLFFRSDVLEQFVQRCVHFIYGAARRIRAIPPKNVR